MSFPRVRRHYGELKITDFTTGGCHVYSVAPGPLGPHSEHSCHSKRTFEIGAFSLLGIVF